MFIKPVDHIQKTKPFSKPYKGTVVSNDDPRQINRIKVNIPGFIEGDEEDLPWIFADNPAGLGGREDLSGSTVPVVGSQVKVEFPFEDIYSGFYTGYWQSEGTHQGSVFNEDYPESYGFRDEQGTHVKINKTKKFFELQHTSGARVFIDEESLIQLRSRKAIEFISEDGKTKITFDMVTGEMELNPKEGLNLGGNIVTIATPVAKVLAGSVDEDITGSKVTQVLGGHKLKIGGSHSKNVVGSSAESIAGDDSKLVAGESEATYGQGRSETVALGDLESELLAGNRNISILVGNYKIDLTAGNYDVDVKAGNLTLKTLAGEVEIANAIANMKLGIAGDIEIANATGSMTVGVAGDVKISALPSLDLIATGIATLKGALVNLGNGTAPIVTTLSDPLEDLITGKPKIGVPTVLAG